MEIRQVVAKYSKEDRIVVHRSTRPIKSISEISVLTCQDLNTKIVNPANRPTSTKLVRASTLWRGQGYGQLVILISTQKVTGLARAIRLGGVDLIEVIITQGEDRKVRVRYS
ncbi:MAG: hypothetical protein O7B27_00465 [Gammaproteobacteria bacterium]|nr:hypothetical protein [Gammaproteobacteria bacterium]